MAEEEPVFISILLDLVRPQVVELTPDQHLKAQRIPNRLKEIGVLDQAEAIQLLKSKGRLVTTVEYILGDFWRQ